MKISLSQAIMVMMLCCTIYAENQITLANDSYLTEMKKVCDSAPVSNLNMCNNTCLQCIPGNSYKCSSCNSQFAFKTDSCLIDNSIHSYTVYNYLNALSAELMRADIQKFIYADTQTTIGVDKVLQVCKANSYQLFMAGPFKDTNSIGITYQFVDPIDQIQIKFNFMSLVQDMTLLIDINDQTVFLKKFTIFSDLIGTYGKNANNAGPNYMFINALDASNVGSVISQVDTGVINVISNKISITIYTQSSSTGYNWGYSDFVVIQRKCQTCVTQAVKDLLSRLGTLCFSVLIVVVVLILILFFMIKFEDLHRKLAFQRKLGSSDSLPLKAIDRVILSLQRSSITMDKQFKRQRRLLRVTKRE